MTTPIILTLQRHALDNQFPITELLRMAYAAAVKLNLSDFQEWAGRELNGYGKNEVPDYRSVKGNLRAFNQFRGWISVQMPDNEWQRTVSTYNNGQSIAEVEQLASANGTITVDFPVERVLLLQEIFNFDGEFRIFIGHAAMENILSAVRNRILEWALQLESDGILGNGISFSREEKEKAKVSGNIHIGNFQGVLGDVSESTVTQNLNLTVSQGDFDQLADVLRSHKVPFDDITELKAAIEEDGYVDGKSGLGKKVSGWIGKMTVKACDGSWNMAIATAANVLGTAINGYYGIGL